MSDWGSHGLEMSQHENIRYGGIRMWVWLETWWHMPRPISMPHSASPPVKKCRLCWYISPSLAPDPFAMHVSYPHGLEFSMFAGHGSQLWHVLMPSIWRLPLQIACSLPQPGPCSAGRAESRRGLGAQGGWHRSSHTPHGRKFPGAWARDDGAQVGTCHP